MEGERKRKLNNTQEADKRKLLLNGRRWHFRAV